MFKEAFLCGLGMVVDISGMSYVQATPPRATPHQKIGLYWNHVGGFISKAAKVEGEKVEAAKLRQLDLDLKPAQR